MNKKILSAILIAVFCIIPFTQHIHDEFCGYDEKTNSGCVYEIEKLSDQFIGD